ncbi:heterokaryon incompatibility protein-domain-containing protein [Hypoxylon trugodes]|uniref:heterokaryon incompatibility protein-domain-containing protein n=1 Tax=Hypoxylon trugodes TaxID=326681 RepID=UPI0021A0331F|nr:heterokaryon incompatibility protein-domain-containing protein [Hypoxylon trugodes]KAI1383058.1 heterokaryon incompatibility protein-domain-containing protein [Hypoxylon trugodes]
MACRESLKVNDCIYRFVAKEGNGRSELQRFDDPELDHVENFQYERLSSNTKSIRLLRLKPAASTVHQIDCQLIEADYDNAFHILTKPRILEKMREEKAEAYKKYRRLGTKEERPIYKEFEKEWKDKEYKIVSENRIEYEAISWCWGEEREEYAIRIERGEKSFKRTIKRNLALALKHLRRADETRTIWIDSMCINQRNDIERNHQVQMMSRIYTRADQVCIWLGQADGESGLAIRFIKEEIMVLKNFDAICSDKKYTHKWRALMVLMQRPWFSRRWMIQEIALDRKGTIYCGSDQISWSDFAVAVELFVEVETATHRLSEVMQKDEKFRHVPGWFEHVSELGASLLVQATSKVFRTQKVVRFPQDIIEEELLKKSSSISPKEPSGGSSRESPSKSPEGLPSERPSELANQYPNEQHEKAPDLPTIDPLERRSLLGLQYLVTTIFIFQTSEPRDVIYSLLAIARDASPSVEDSALKDENYKLFMRTGLSSFLEEKPFRVDYSRPYTDVCRDFVEFSICRAYRLDPVQALDILCRPWALEQPKNRSIRLAKDPVSTKGKGRTREPKRDGWTMKHRKYEYIFGRWEEKTNDQSPIWTERESCGGNVGREKKKKRGWEPGQQYKEKHFPDLAKLEKRKSSPDPRSYGASEANTKNYTENADLQLPSWILRASSAPFGLFHHPGMNIQKTGRINADPLVGAPEDGHRNYNANQTQSVDMAALKFRKRPPLLHYSLLVKGFVFDEVVKVTDASQNGSIPATWLELGGWKDPQHKDPPDEFWRTLVADRGKDNRNPPYYYSRACRESAMKGGLRSGGINTIALINDERNSIISEFCRRVQAVIWNRRLFKTKGGVLGLASSEVSKGDKVGIIYGCTVPVILRKSTKKTSIEVDREEFDDAVESLRE